MHVIFSAHLVQTAVCALQNLLLASADVLLHFLKLNGTGVFFHFSHEIICSFAVTFKAFPSLLVLQLCLHDLVATRRT